MLKIGESGRVSWVSGDLNRAQVGDFFPVGEGNSAGGESDDADDDENDSDNGDWLHGVVALSRAG